MNVIQCLRTNTLEFLLKDMMVKRNFAKRAYRHVIDDVRN